MRMANFSIRLRYTKHISFWLHNRESGFRSRPGHVGQEEYRPSESPRASLGHSKKMFRDRHQERTPKNLHTKSERLTLICRVILPGLKGLIGAVVK
jgi:hypothetical protein